MFALGLGVAVLPVIWVEPDRASISLALSKSTDKPIAELAASARCEAALKLATSAGQIPQIDPTAADTRIPNNNVRAVKVAFSTKNSRGIDLAFVGWCEVWPDGRTEIVRFIETEGRDLLASSQPTGI